MKRMVQYKVKPERVAENERYVRAVYEELHRVRPVGLRYATFRLPDGQSFIHLVSNEAPDGANPLTALPDFKAFLAELRERCETPPATTDLEEIGSYGFFDR
ncbi:hypothetical protein [Variovorax sp. DT-64]|uniref:hypothetical protein n=1 Tax=Variovorax sp. DT-64 TaxID=3396160 RepID=UPI003F1E05DD